MQHATAAQKAPTAHRALTQRRTGGGTLSAAREAQPDAERVRHIASQIGHALPDGWKPGLRLGSGLTALALVNFLVRVPCASALAPLVARKFVTDGKFPTCTKLSVTSGACLQKCCRQPLQSALQFDAIGLLRSSSGDWHQHHRPKDPHSVPGAVRERAVSNTRTAATKPTLNFPG